jgi:hypothetical protein
MMPPRSASDGDKMPDKPKTKKPAIRNSDRPGFAAKRQLKCNIARSNKTAGKVSLAPVSIPDVDEPA